VHIEQLEDFRQPVADHRVVRQRRGHGPSNRTGNDSRQVAGDLVPPDIDPHIRAHGRHGQDPGHGRDRRGRVAARKNAIKEGVGQQLVEHDVAAGEYVVVDARRHFGDRAHHAEPHAHGAVLHRVAGHLRVSARVRRAHEHGPANVVELVPDNVQVESRNRVVQRHDAGRRVAHAVILKRDRRAVLHEQRGQAVVEQRCARRAARIAGRHS